MTASKTLQAALAALALLSATAVPALAVSIRHTNRAEGDPDAVSVPAGHATPPADTTGAHAFDKAHESGRVY